jgi:WD40 repeat protein
MLATIVDHEWIPMSYIRVVDIATGEDKQLLPITSTMSLDSERFCEESRERIFFAPDGKRIFVRDAADVLTAVDISSGRVLWRHALDEFPAEFAVLPDGCALAVAQHPTIRLIDAATGKERVREPELGHQRPVQDAVFSSDGRFAATACRQRIIRWDLASGRPLPPLQNPPTYVNAPKLSGDGRSIVALSDSTLRSWDFHTGKLLRRVSVTVNDIVAPKLLSVSHDGATVAIGDCRSPLQRDPTDLLLVDVVTGKTLESGRIYGDFATSSNATFSADGDTFRVWSTYDGILHRWQFARNPKTGMFKLSQRKFNITPLRDPAFSFGLLTYTDQVTVSPDERHLLYNHGPGALSIYATANGKELATQDVDSPVQPLTVFSPDGRTIARTDDDDRSIHIIERATFIERQHIATSQRKIHALNFSPDGKRLITANDDSTALIWDLVGTLSHRPGRTLSPKDLAARWTDLASSDGTRVQHAIDDLAASPNEAVPFLVARLQSVLFFDEKAIARLIADLDAESFEVRDSANQKLAALEFQPVHLYRKALAASPSPETRRRLNALVVAQDKLWRSPSSGHLRLLRSLEALELAATPDARRLLESLAKGDPSSWLTLEAAGSVERLRRRSP